METFSKAERICSKLLIEKLFAGGNPSMAAYPLRAVFMTVSPDDPKLPHDAPVQVLISIPKRKLRRAVDRNRMKRQVREAYRRNKQQLCDLMQERGETLALAFVCIGDTPCSSAKMTQSVCSILRRVGERLKRRER